MRRSRAALRIERAAGGREDIPLNSFFSVGAGDVIELREMGGPGFGDPMRRDPERVARDVRDGYLSVAKAREVYGVALKADGTVDQAATSLTRAERGRGDERGQLQL